MMIRTVATRSALVALGLLVTVSLSGCLSPGSGILPTLLPSTPGPSETSTPTELPSPSNSATPAEKPTPVSIPCKSVIDAQTMYDFNPNFGLLAKFSPEAGTLAARAATDDGTVCRWINQTSDDTIDVSISQPGPNAFAAAKAAADSGTSVSGLGDAAYFSSSGGTGVVQVFDGPRWLTATSVYFASAGDANSIISAVISAAG